MKTKEFVKKFKAIMYEPKERFDDVEFKKSHLVPTGIEINDDFSRSYFFDSEVFGIEDNIIMEHIYEWDKIVEKLRIALLELDDVYCVYDYITKDSAGIEIRVNIKETKNIKKIIKADLANAGEGFNNNYPLDKDNWIHVGIYNGQLEIGDHINGAYIEETVVVDSRDNFDAAWEQFIEGLYIARIAQWKAGHRKTSLGIKNALFKLGEFKEVSSLF